LFICCLLKFSLQNLGSVDIQHNLELAQLGISIDVICQITGLSADEIA
jgi:hypothetical protein